MKKILFAGLIAGTLDAIAAILLYANPLNLHNISSVFRYIAGGIFGEKGQPAGIIYPAMGLILHFLIAISWSAVYFLLLFRVFNPGSVWAKVILLATVIWIIMNGFVMPLTGVMSRYDGWAIMRSFGVILVCVSLPICLIAEKNNVKK
jgi:hypothetical protein